MSYATGIHAIARLDAADVLRSRWLWFMGAGFAALASIFVLVGLRESTVLGFTGMGRVLLSFSHALVFVLPLLALMLTAQVINRSRDDGSLELLLSQPISRTQYFIGVTAVRVLALVLPFAGLMLAAALYGRWVLNQPIPWAFFWRCVATCSALIWSFCGVGLVISVYVRHPAKALACLLAAWVLGVALLDFGLIGLLLQWRLSPMAVFVLAALNPVESARLAMLSAAEPDLAIFGPVGFFLSTRVGATGLFLIGLLWPLGLGSALWTLAWWRFRTADVV